MRKISFYNSDYQQAGKECIHQEDLLLELHAVHS